MRTYDEVKELRKENQELKIKMYGEGIINIAEKYGLKPEIVIALRDEFGEPKSGEKVPKATPRNQNEPMTYQEAIGIVEDAVRNNPKGLKLRIDNPNETIQAFDILVEKLGKQRFNTKIASLIGLPVDRVCSVTGRLGVKVYAYPETITKPAKKKEIPGIGSEFISPEQKLTELFQKDKTFWHTIDSIHQKTGLPVATISDFLAKKVPNSRIETQLDSDGKVKFKVSI
jgi:hypothetical protein